MSRLISTKYHVASERAGMSGGIGRSFIVQFPSHLAEFLEHLSLGYAPLLRLLLHSDDEIGYDWDIFPEKVPGRDLEEVGSCCIETGLDEGIDGLDIGIRETGGY